MNKKIIILALILILGACSMPDSTKIEEERISIRLAAPHNPYIDNFDTNYYKLWLEEQTGLDIELIWLPESDAESLIRTALLTGEDLPDAYIGFGSASYEIFNNLNLQKHAERGTILPLNDLIAEYGANIQAVWDEFPEYNIKDFMTMPDGNIYYMPGFSSSLITRYIRNLMWVNKDWLDALNLDIPETIEQFRDMLILFKTGDPNKNNITDEIPLAGTEEHYGKQVYDFIFNSFIYNDTKHDRLFLSDGRVKFAPVTGEWREALKYMRELYQEGLISPFSFTQSDQQLRQMANDPRNILGAFASPGITFTVQQNSPEIMRRYTGIAPLIGPDGVRFASVSIPLPKPNGVITSASQYPELVFKLFDLMLSEPACLIGRYGEEGVDWMRAEPGDSSIYGTPATIKLINQLWNNPQNKHICQIGPYISRPKFSGGVTWDGSETDGEYINAQAALLYRAHEPREFIGALVYTAEEEASILDIRVEAEDWVRSNIIDFITGERDIYSDEEWTAYINYFDKLGLDTLIKTAQTALDRAG